jgi:hypothetical protein
MATSLNFAAPPVFAAGRDLGHPVIPPELPMTPEPDPPASPLEEPEPAPLDPDAPPHHG